MSKRAYKWPDDFKDWQQMHMTPSGFWIYFSPDNLLAALVWVEEKIVLIISDRHTNTPIYENREMVKLAVTRKGLRNIGRLSFEVKRLI